MNTAQILWLIACWMIAPFVAAILVGWIEGE